RAMSRGTAMLISALGPPAPKLRNTSRKLSQPICGWSISTWVPSDSTRRSLMVTPCTSMRMPGSSCAITSTCPPTSPTLSRVAEAMSMTRSSPGAMSHFSVIVVLFLLIATSRYIACAQSNTIYLEFVKASGRIARKDRLTLTQRQLLRWSYRRRQERSGCHGLVDRGDRAARGYHEQDAASLRRHRPACTLAHREQRLPALRRGRSRAPAAHPAAARTRARPAADRRGARASRWVPELVEGPR